MVKIRPAGEEDRRVIRKMVFAENLDPTSLKWQNFLVAELVGSIVGIGQVRKHRGCRELGSLVVLKEYRERGIAGRLMAELEKAAGYPIFLFCEAKMEGYYTGHGYEVISWRDVPTALRLKLLPTFLFRIFGIRVLVMRKGQTENAIVKKWITIGNSNRTDCGSISERQ